MSTLAYGLTFAVAAELAGITFAVALCRAAARRPVFGPPVSLNPSN